MHEKYARFILQSLKWIMTLCAVLGVIIFILVLLDSRVHPNRYSSWWSTFGGLPLIALFLFIRWQVVRALQKRF